MSLAQKHRSDQLALRAVMMRTLISLWPALRADALDETFPAWALSVGQLIIARRAVSVNLARQYLQAERYASGVPGPPTIVPAPPLDPQRIATSLRVTSVVPVKKATAAPLVRQSPAGPVALQAPIAPRALPTRQAMDNAFVQSSGAATRLALDGGRETVMQSGLADVKVSHFKRVTSASPCAFCALLATRGAVYKSALTAAFKDGGDGFHSYHDHCSCTVEIVYGNVAGLDEQAQRDKDLYEQATAGVRGSKEALSAFRTAYDKQRPQA